MKKNASLIRVAAAALVLSGGCTTNPAEEVHYVNVSQAACSFLGEGSKPLAIVVDAAPAQWTAEPGASWVKVERTDATTLTVTVDDNDTGTERSADITVQAGEAVRPIRVYQLPKDNSIARYRTTNTFDNGTAVVSPSGRYVGGFESTLLEDGNTFEFWPVIIDVEADERIVLGPVHQSLHMLHEPHAISDQGLLFIADGQNGGQVAFDITGNSFVPEIPEGYKTLPEIQAVSADGRYWVGYSKNNDGLHYTLVWEDGVLAKQLPMPDKNFVGEDFWYGILGRGISADGSVIYGTTWENWDFGMVYWKDWQNGGQAEYVGKDVHVRKVEKALDSQGLEYDYYCADGMICQANRTNISPSGKWIAGSYRTWTLAENRMDAVTSQVAAFYDVETETTVIVDEYGESTGTHVTDDGIGFIGLGSLGISSGRVYDCNTRTDLGTTQEWVYDNYGIIIPNCYVTSISPDGTVVFGRYLESSAGGHMKFPGWYVAPPVAE